MTMDDKSCREMVRTCADFNLRRATRLVSQAFDQALKPTGLKITQFSLMVAAYMNQNLILNKLARVMGMDRTTLSRNLAVLERRGLVEMEQGDDRREVRVQLTPTGLELMEQAAPLWHKAQEKITAGLGPEGWEDTLANLRALVKSLK